MNNVYNINLLDILPPSIKRDPQVQALSAAFSPEYQEVSNAILQCILLARLDEQPEEVVDLLAWQLHVDYYEAEMPIEKKREMVRLSTPWHRHKGTPWAVEQAVSMIFQNAVVSEWFEYGGQPYYFRVETEQPFTADTDLNRLIKLINSAKNTRSWLENITIKRKITMGNNYGGVLHFNGTIGIGPMAFVMPNIDSGQYYGGVICCWNKISINQEVN